MGKRALDQMFRFFIIAILETDQVLFIKYPDVQSLLRI